GGCSMTSCTVSFSAVVCYLFFFFFSSRRRHTRFSRDWSSDVCSSDLPDRRVLRGDAPPRPGVRPARRDGPGGLACPEGLLEPGRSEERRVGKECRSRWAPEQ